MKDNVAAYLDYKFEKIKLLRKTDKNEVWLAEDKFSKKFVVLKFINFAGLPYEKLKNNPHPLWTKIFYFAEDSSDTVVVEEFIQGESLVERLDRKNFLSAKEAEKYLLQMCDGLKFLHELGIIHRDIKPSNLILQGEKIRLIDFDAARQVKSDKNEDTIFLGTKNYAPPEQYGYGQTDARSDIFTLGVTFKLLLGKNYRGKLKKILSKCTELDPKNRFQNADELKNALLAEEPKTNYKFAVIFFIVFVCTIFFSVNTADSPTKNSPAEKIPNSEKIKKNASEKISDDKISKPGEKNFEFPEIIFPTQQNNFDAEKNSPIQPNFETPQNIPTNSGKIETEIYLNGNIFNQFLENDIKISPEELTSQNVKLQIKNNSAVTWNEPKLKIVFSSNFGKKSEEIKNLPSLNVGESANISIPLNFYDIAKDANQTWLQIWLIGNENLLTEKYWCVVFSFRE